MMRSLFLKKSDFRKIFLLFVFWSFSLNVVANKSGDAYDKWYNYISTQLVSTDINKALHMADSLLLEAKTSEQTLKSNMLLAIVHSYRGDLPISMSHALKTYELARTIENFEWLVRSSGFLSTMFRNIGLYDLGDSYLQRAKNHVQRLAKLESYKLTLANIYHEESFYLSMKGQYKEALKPLLQANKLLTDVSGNPRGILICATNMQLHGVSYLELKDFDKAEHYLGRSLKIIEPHQSLLKAYIYRAYGELWMQKKDYAKALPYIKQAEIYIKGSDNAELKSLVYKSYMHYYKAVDDSDKFILYSDLYVNVIRKRDEIGKMVSNQLIKELEQSSTKNEYSLTILYVSGLSVLLLIICLAIFFRKKLYTIAVKPAKRKAGPEGKEFYMLKETEDRLLQALFAFEQKHEFLNKDISIGLLASQLNTNTKYLSQVINKHKECDFNNYINELRIRYIQQELRTNPTLLNYKLAYISGLAGFSSHSKFAAIFKHHAGLSPSVFIQQLKEEINDNG